MKTKRDIIIVIRFCFTNLGGDYSKIKCPAARSEQALVICHSCTSDLCTPYSQLLPAGAFPATSSAAAQGGLGLSWECLKGHWMGELGRLLCFSLVWALAGIELASVSHEGDERAEGKAELSRNWTGFLSGRWKQIPGKQGLIPCAAPPADPMGTNPSGSWRRMGRKRSNGARCAHCCWIWLGIGCYSHR